MVVVFVSVKRSLNMTRSQLRRREQVRRLWDVAERIDLVSVKTNGSLTFQAAQARRFWTFLDLVADRNRSDI